jgi:hypothetical protein
MTDFIKPTGINFRCVDTLPAPDLARLLCRMVAFLQDIEPYAKLRRYNDWWEHDGLHFYKSPIDFNDLFGIVRSPRSLLEAMPGDEDVLVGMAPQGNSWYLRFYLCWDEDGFDLLDRFDITLPECLAEGFRNEVARDAGVEIKEQSAESYYQTIIR